MPTIASPTVWAGPRFDVDAIRCPVAVLHGSSDMMTEPVNAHPHCGDRRRTHELRIVDDLGHFSIEARDRADDHRADRTTLDDATTVCLVFCLGYRGAMNTHPHQASSDEADPEKESTPAGVVGDLEEKAEEEGGTVQPDQPKSK